MIVSRLMLAVGCLSALWLAGCSDAPAAKATVIDGGELFGRSR